MTRIIQVTNAFDGFMAAAGVRLASSSVGPLSTVEGESYFDQIAAIDAGYWQDQRLVPMDASALAASGTGRGVRPASRAGELLALVEGPGSRRVGAGMQDASSRQAQKYISACAYLLLPRL